MPQTPSLVSQRGIIPLNPFMGGIKTGGSTSIPAAPLTTSQTPTWGGVLGNFTGSNQYPGGQSPTVSTTTGANLGTPAGITYQPPPAQTSGGAPTVPPPITGKGTSAVPPVIPPINPSIGGAAQGGLTPEQIAAANAAPQGQQGASALGGTPTTFPGTVTGLVGMSSQSSPQYQAAQSQYNTANQQLADLKKAAANNQFIGAGTNMAEYAGTQGLIANRLANEENALTSEMTAAQSAAQTATGQQSTQQTGLGTAGGLVKPQLGGYNQQAFTAMGQPISQGGGVNGTAMSQLPTQAQTAIQSYAQQIKTGMITRADAESKLSAYGQPGLNALNEALGSGFNTNASNASGATTAVGQQLSAAIPPANQAMDALQSAFNDLGTFSGSSVPFLQEFAQNAAMQTGIGRENVSKFKGALQEARSRIDAALTGVIGVDAAGKQANALLPDNMTSAEIPQKITAAKQYLQNQLQSYTKSGQQNGTTNAGSQWSW